MGQLLKYGKFDEKQAMAEKDESESASSGVEMFKFQVGKNVIRILPPPVGQSSPFKVVYQHFVDLPGTKKSFVCARVEAKKHCPICKKIDELKASPSKVDRDAAEDMFAKRRIFVNIIDRRNPDKGPLTVGIGKTVHEGLLGLRDEETGGDYCDPENGYDAVITRTGSGKNDTKYTVALARKSTPLAGTVDDPDIDKMQEWIDMQNDLSRFARLPDKQEVAELLAGGSDEDEEEEEAPRRQLPPKSYKKKKVAAKTKAKPTRGRSVEDDSVDVEDEDVVDAEIVDEDEDE